MAINVSTHDVEPSDAVRYYFLSRRLDAEAFSDPVRGHWGIENSLHRQLGVTFGEHRCRVRAGPADANLGVVRRTALGLLENEKTEKLGVKNKRLRAACNTGHLEQVLFASEFMMQSP